MRKGKGMKKRIISKILTLLVVFSMVFTLLPVNNKIVHAGDGKVNIGDYIYLGTYQGKKIKWRCIGEDSNGKLMLSDQILCKKSYDAKYSGIKTTSGLKADQSLDRISLETLDEFCRSG